MCKKILLLSLILFLSTAQSRSKNMFEEEKAENLRYNKTIRAFMAESKYMTDLVHKSYAYVVFPSIGKGGVIFGYASGEGRAFMRGGIWAGNVSVSQYSFGLQVGGQAYSEIIFFDSREAFELFKTDGFFNSTQASLVPFVSGISGDVNFTEGVQVYTSAKGGFMLDASTGAQDFEYTQRR